MNVNNTSPYYIPKYTPAFRNEAPHRNVNGLNNRELAERALSLEMRLRADPDGRLAKAHILEINAMRAANRGTGRSIGLNTPTAASETLRNRHIDAIRELMSEQEQDSFKIDILQRMLENAMRPPTNNDPRTIAERVARANANNGFNTII